MIYINPAFIKASGYSKNELIGKNFKEFNFYTDIQNAQVKEREELIKEGEIPKPREVLLKRKDKNEFWSRSYIVFSIFLPPFNLLPSPPFPRDVSGL